MIYISDKEINRTSLDWSNNIDVIERAITCLKEKEYAQPIKPYLRYRDLQNRIIAMPAFVGGPFNLAGIKWISSFPENIQKGLPRAHCVVILNDAENGKPLAILNTGIISTIRTASVSGFVLRKFLEKSSPQKTVLGIIGFGPIGQYHLKMCNDILGDTCERVLLFDLKKIDCELIEEGLRDKVQIADSWEEVYSDSDIFITCTVSRERYIDKAPRPGSLHLNVSLRDYKSTAFDWFKKGIIVDDWEEVCRENTDIEMFHIQKGLKREDVWSIQDLLTNEWSKPIADEQAIMFNPMGMAIFDIAISHSYVERITRDNKASIL